MSNQDPLVHRPLTPGVVWRDLEDRQLLEHLRMGELQAYATLMTRYMNALTRFAYLIVRSHDVADDVVQHVFIKLWEHKNDLRSDTAIKSYLYKLVRNRALNEKRNLQVRDKYQHDAQADALAGGVSSYALSTENELLNSLTLQSLIDDLPERRRIALRLRVREGLSHSEIAEVLEISPAAAQRLVARAIEDLRNKIWSV